ncbi:DinB family protein [Caryophanon latum]|uniref:Damage-inducible protein DinB n=1 Tax=Caryophanon latum TaxID=33977 RepID=A0A1C0YV98_9BACL|nr:DinB family protein [Caryophanon latum]OCS91072.1 damage-inducible protein DinB [Caryophanon latum]
MYRTIEDFQADWAKSAEGTTRVFEALTDDKLHVAIADEHNSLGWLAWHLTTSPSFFGNVLADFGFAAVENAQTTPASAADIVAAYKRVVQDVTDKMNALTDEDLLKPSKLPDGTLNGGLLRLMIDHQTHHRGQMTVLLRQAGLPVPSVMGPTKEDQQA